MYKALVICFICFPFLLFAQIGSVELEIKPVVKPLTRDTAVDYWNLSSPDYRNLSQQSKDVLYWTNYCRRNPGKFWDSVIAPMLVAFPTLNTAEAISLKADLTKAGSLPMFSLNPTLIKTAQLHANDIGRKQAAPSHTSTNGTDFGTRMRLAGIKTCASENISVGNLDVLISVLLLYLDIGLPELGHRKSLLNPSLQEIGIGYSPYGKERFFVVEDMACRQQ